jgi:hypothetical protein
MQLLPSATLEDPRFTVPRCPPATHGIAWLRGRVPRFCDGSEHDRRRDVLEQVLRALDVRPRSGQQPTESLLAAAGRPTPLCGAVAAAAAGYQPHPADDPTLTAAAVEAVERLVVACGDRTERTAMLICILVQAHAGLQAVGEQRRTGRAGAPIPATRRVDPDGRDVFVDLTDAPFGVGAHGCPGRLLAADLDASAGTGDHERHQRAERIHRG